MRGLASLVPKNGSWGIRRAGQKILYNHRMNRRIFFLSAVLLSATFMAAAPAVAQNSAVTTDPAPDKANPAAMQSFQLPSHGALLNAFVYIASGAGPHPTVILLHGFPGNERNLDLAQSIRRAGWNALYFDYRGSWGSPGEFSFTHCIEDTEAAIAYLRDSVHASAFRGDAKTIVLAGHSMGGFMAYQAGAPSQPSSPSPPLILAPAAFNRLRPTSASLPSAAWLLFWRLKTWRRSLAQRR